MRRPVIVVALVVAVLGGAVTGPTPPAEGATEPPPTVSEHLAGLPLAEDEVGEPLVVGRFGAAGLIAGAEDSGAADPLGGAADPLPGAEDSGAAGPLGGAEGSGAAGSLAGEAVRSARVATPIPFSTVGFSLPEGARVWFRTSVDGQQWEPWQAAPARDGEHGPDPGSVEQARAAPAGQRTSAVWVGEASWLQVRVRDASPTEVGATLIDGMGLSESLPQRVARALRSAWEGSAEPDTAAAAVQSPDVVSRAEWGADESRRGHEPHYTSDVEMGVVHHTAGANDYSQAEAPGVVRGVYRWHTEGNGWSDIGYNLLVDRFGNVYEGRHGGLEKGVIGAHVRGRNDDSFGVSLMGCFDPGCADGGAAVTEEAREALTEVLAWKFDVHHVDVRGRAHVDGQSTPTLVGHGDLGETSCPGRAVRGLLDELAADVDERQQAQGGVILDPGVNPASASLADGGLQDAVELSSRLRGPGEWTLEILDPESQVVRTERGSGETARSRWRGTGDLATGTYTFRFSSPGRRSATGTFEVSPPCDQAFCDVRGSVHEAAILSLAERGVVSGCAEERYCPREEVRRDHMAAFTARALELEPETGTAGARFADVDGNPHEDHINALADHGIVRGNHGDFMPSQPLSRDQMAAFLARSLELEAESDGHFSDVEGSVHEDAVDAIAEAGVTKGYGDGTYRPRAHVLRDQIASFLQRALEADEGQ